MSFFLYLEAEQICTLPLTSLFDESEQESRLRKHAPRDDDDMLYLTNDVLVFFDFPSLSLSLLRLTITLKHTKLTRPR